MKAFQYIFTLAIFLFVLLALISVLLSNVVDRGIFWALMALVAVEVERLVEEGER